MLAGESLSSEPGQSEALHDPGFAHLGHQPTWPATELRLPLLWPSKTLTESEIVKRKDGIMHLAETSIC